MHGPRSRFLAISFVLLIVAALALTACNSTSVSGSQTKPGSSANAEAKSPSRPGARSQGMVDAAIANIR